MLILCVGDTHTDIDRINVHVRALRRDHGIEIDLALQFGDLGFYRDYGDWKRCLKGTLKFEVPTIAVHGNHENEESANAAMGEFGSLVPNFKCLALGEYFIFQKGDEQVRLFGVGGAPCVDNPPRNQKYAYDADDFLRAQDAWISMGRPEVDILMTHEVPYGTGLKGDPRIAAMFGLNPHLEMGEKKLTDLMREMKPRWQMNGHHHRWWGPIEFLQSMQVTLPVAQAGFGVIDTNDWKFTTAAVR